ncbi:thiopeptide-type bacteriocin biosynthesis protein [Streptomyces endophyticus]|uniref:Thiopeptide-type bacteriocin biosynthesis protein n=1 Tax=Streptomyces endophyticus TaxID=714166 RepID=A0ABU6EZ71_9ACTN|nr:thiopeptide-type bacteriocin biosynthesis protein [Streptomyces endophyticus]MEB8337053.1 thiopeptide-type bacteriocin biosynthesis protein [Streptomyces endophyticus]
MDQSELDDALALFQQAGHAALADQETYRGWFMTRVQFHDGTVPDRVVHDHLLPLLQNAQDQGLLAQWWFIRKPPGWRMRFLPCPEIEPAEMRNAISLDLGAMSLRHRINSWTTAVYEPETAAFGGPVGMDIAHALFHADSTHILTTYATGNEPPLGRREMSVLLLSTLMRGAGLEWYEQGDVWDRVCQDRPLPPGVAPVEVGLLREAVHSLATTDTKPSGGLLGGNGPLASQGLWVEAFAEAGSTLSDAAGAKRLRRGLRESLAYHVLFHWNRLGLAGKTQAILAHAARTMVLEAA